VPPRTVAAWSMCGGGQRRSSPRHGSRLPGVGPGHGRGGDVPAPGRNPADADAARLRGDVADDRTRVGRHPHHPAVRAGSLPHRYPCAILGADGLPAMWGDPYTDFVGHVMGSEPGAIPTGRHTQGGEPMRPSSREPRSRSAFPSPPSSPAGTPRPSTPPLRPVTR